MMNRLLRCSRTLRVALFSLFVLAAGSKSYSQVYSVQVDALNLLTTTLNVEVSAAINERWTVHLPVKYNPWEFGKEKFFKQLTFQPGVRCWFTQSYSQGFFAGVNAQLSWYDRSRLFSGKSRYDGRELGVGVSGGYSLPVGKRWNVEIELGLAAVQRKETRTKYEFDPDEESGISERDLLDFAPGKIGVSIVYLF